MADRLTLLCGTNEGSGSPPRARGRRAGLLGRPAYLVDGARRQGRGALMRLLICESCYDRGCPDSDTGLTSAVPMRRMQNMEWRGLAGRGADQRTSCPVSVLRFAHPVPFAPRLTRIFGGRAERVSRQPHIHRWIFAKGGASPAIHSHLPGELPLPARTRGHPGGSCITRWACRRTSCTAEPKSWTVAMPVIAASTWDGFQARAVADRLCRPRLVFGDQHIARFEATGPGPIVGVSKNAYGMTTCRGVDCGDDHHQNIRRQARAAGRRDRSALLAAARSAGRSVPIRLRSRIGGRVFMTVRVVLADEQAVVRAGLRALFDLTDDLVVVAEAGDGARAVEAVCATRPDVVLMDIGMPGGGGIEATEGSSPTRTWTAYGSSSSPLTVRTLMSSTLCGTGRPAIC
ncbi:Protein-glutamate methylesterase/protein-glutamine glutaminase [Streptomyces californicus]